MMMPTFTLLLAAATARFTSAQNCYFPNGDVAPDSSPCGGSSKVCCPLNWECLSNGLCYLPNEPYYGRYSCTDSSWGSGCPDYCTYNGTAYGNEAIGKCSGGSWCCDMDRQHGDCCKMSGAEVIDVPSGSVTATVTQTPDPTSEASPAESTSSTSTSSSTSQTPTAIPTTITTQEATTDSQGAATTVVIVSTATYTPAPTTEDSSSQQQDLKDNTPLIAGLAAGIPGVLTAAALITFLLYRRRKSQQQQDQNPSTSTFSSSGGGDMKYMYDNVDPSGQPPEIDSYPTVRHSTISELSGSSPSYQSPAISSMHSPYASQGPFGGYGSLQQVREEKEEPQQQPLAPVELAGADNEVSPERRSSYPGQALYGGGLAQQQQRTSTGAGGYVAYRPPDGVAEETAGVQGAGEPPPISPASPRMDHGRLGGGGLRIVNQ